MSHVDKCHVTSLNNVMLRQTGVMRNMLQMLWGQNVSVTRHCPLSPSTAAALNCSVCPPFAQEAHLSAAHALRSSPCPSSGPVDRRGSRRGHPWRLEALLVSLALPQAQGLAVALYDTVVGGPRLRALCWLTVAFEEAIVGDSRLCVFCWLALVLRGHCRRLKLLGHCWRQKLSAFSVGPPCLLARPLLVAQGSASFVGSPWFYEAIVGDPRLRVLCWLALVLRGYCWRPKLFASSAGSP